MRKPGVYASRIVRNHPLVDGNKRTAWQVMRYFLLAADVQWRDAGQRRQADAMVALAAGTLSERDFTEWVRTNLI